MSTPAVDGTWHYSSYFFRPSYTYIDHDNWNPGENGIKLSRHADIAIVATAMEVGTYVRKIYPHNGVNVLWAAGSVSFVPKKRYEWIAVWEGSIKDKWLELDAGN